MKSSAVASFIRFVVFGGGVGVLSSFAVVELAMGVPWGVSNAVVTVASTVLCTELHARYTFGKKRGAEWREHSLVTEQVVYLGASGLAGVGRFLVLRLFVFAGERERSARGWRLAA